MPTNSLYHTLNHANSWNCGRDSESPKYEFHLAADRTHLSRAVRLSQVAGKIPGEAKLTSATLCLGRLLDNPAIHVRAWYEPIARQWLEAQVRDKHPDPIDLRWNENWFSHINC